MSLCGIAGAHALSVFPIGDLWRSREADLDNPTPRLIHKDSGPAPDSFDDVFDERSQTAKSLAIPGLAGLSAID